VKLRGFCGIRNTRLLLWMSLIIPAMWGWTLRFVLRKFCQVISGLDWLRAGRSGDRIPVGARFFVHVQTGPGAHLAFCKWVPGLSRGQRGRGVVLTTHPLLVPRSRRSTAIHLPTPRAFGSVTGCLTFTLISGLPYWRPSSTTPVKLLSSILKQATSVFFHDIQNYFSVTF
jgi:hypothetical protein